DRRIEVFQHLDEALVRWAQLVAQPGQQDHEDDQREERDHSVPVEIHSRRIVIAGPEQDQPRGNRGRRRGESPGAAGSPSDNGDGKQVEDGKPQVEAGQLVDRSNRRQQDHGAGASHSNPVLAEHIRGCRRGRRLLGLAHGDSYSPQMARRGKRFISRRMRAMTGSAEIERYRTNLQDELDGAALYAALAAAEADPVRKDLFLQLSQAEAEHAKVWKEKLAAAGIQDVRYAPACERGCSRGWRAGSARDSCFPRSLPRSLPIATSTP